MQPDTAYTGQIEITALTLVSYADRPEIREYTLESVDEFVEFWFSMNDPQHSEEIIGVDMRPN